MQLRIARHTSDLDAVVGFYRDGLGLESIAEFGDHDGYSGVMLALPGTNAHLEFTTHHHDATPPVPHRESLLVLYLGTRAAVDDALRRLATAPVPSANPYWDRISVTVEDPDGFRVVLAAARWTDSGPVTDDGDRLPPRHP